MNISSPQYNKLLENIGLTISDARQKIITSINKEHVKANWEIGKHIVEFEQNGNVKAEYGSALLTRLSSDLKLEFGKGFSRRNVLDMRRFYICFPKWQTVSAKLSWSHYVLLLVISENEKRNFYKLKSIEENWSVRELNKQINSSLFERYKLSGTKKNIEKLKNNNTIPFENYIKDPYILDFIKIPQNKKLTEKHFEQKLIDNLQLFLLELGKGFAFVSRQYKLSLYNKHFYIDLVFYHRILKCFILIELKTRPVKHTDIGQMNLYLNYFKAEENVEGDNEPIGIILSADKDEILVEYATGGLSNKIFVSKYQLYLPDKKTLQKQLKSALKNE